MRELREKEMRKRGCRYCTQRVMKRNVYGLSASHCPHDECPYHELDKYDTYREYLKHEAPLVMLGDILGFKKKKS